MIRFEVGVDTINGLSKILRTDFNRSPIPKDAKQRLLFEFSHHNFTREKGTTNSLTWTTGFHSASDSERI
jgi:hypothetical protein